jgi:YD repeat-containing protein
MLKLQFVAIFSIFQLISWAQKPFSGDVSERDYINRFGYAQVTKTESGDSPNGSVVKTVFTFGENGVLGTKTVHGKEILTSQYTYDDNGNVLEVTTKNASGKPVSIEKYAYDQQSRLKNADTQLVADNVKKTETVMWLEDGSRHMTRLVNNKEVKILTNFDKYNRPLTEILEDGSVTEWAYTGTIPAMKKYKKGETILNVERYDYDASNRISTIENNQIRKVFTYDANNLLLKTETFDTNGVKIGWEKYEYSFDSK